MREFFKPWRRKIGVVTLGLACVFMAAWLRGQGCRDEITSGVDGNRHKSAYDFHQLILSNDIKWIRLETANISIGLSDGWKAYPTNKLNHFLSDGKAVSRRQWCGFGFEELSAINKHVRVVAWTIPYWSIVIPLTLLSAYLLLSKPRQKPSAVTET